jgi:hypothetical protein
VGALDGQYHRRFTDLPVSRAGGTSVWDRPPVRDAPAGAWIDLRHRIGAPVSAIARAQGANLARGTKVARRAAAAFIGIA